MRTNSPTPPHHAEIRDGVLGAGVGVITGAVAGNYLLPLTTQLGEGIAVTPSLDPLSQGLSMNYGPAVFYAPHVPIQLPLIESGLHVDISQFNIPLNAHGYTEVVDLFSHFHAAVQTPISHTLIEKLAVGGGIGSAVGMTAAIVAGRKLRQSSVLERCKRNPLKVISSTVLGTLALAGCTKAPSVIDDIPSGPNPVRVASVYPNHIASLKDATISGTFGYAAKYIARALTTYSNAVDDSWRLGSRRAVDALQTYQAGPGKQYRLNPDIVSIVHLSDLHCNYSAYKYYFPAVLQALAPDIIDNTGDTFTNSNTAPYEGDCARAFTQDIQQANRATHRHAVEVVVAGNHDPLQLTPHTMPDVIPLDSRNNYTTTVDTITFVGAPDPIRTTWATSPADPVEQNTALAKQGSLLAKTACRSFATTGEAPIVSVHSVAEAYEATIDGCAALVNSGHTHQETGLSQYISPDGNRVLLHSAGSATGANIGPTIDETPQLPATVSVEYFNTVRRRFVGFMTLHLQASNEATITTQSIPNQFQVTFDSANAKKYLQLYSKTASAYASK